MRRSKKTFFVFLSVLSILSALFTMPALAQQDNANAPAVSALNLNLFIHKNDVNGSLWDDYKNQIKVEYFKDDQKLGEAYYPPDISKTQAVNTNQNNALSESFLQFPVVAAPGTYSAKIEAGADGAINRYQTDDQGNVTQNGTIPTHQCGSNPLVPLPSKCENSIQISQDDINRNVRQNRAFSLDLVVIPKELSVQPNVEDTLIEGKNSEYDQMVTFVGRFAARIQSLLNWTLNLTQESFTNPTIERVFSRILNIVNGFFIIVLLAIAFMWNLSIVIPKRYLRRVVVIFIFAAVLVNFALPVNRLLISVTNSVQSSFLVKDVRTEEGVKKQRISSNDLLMIYGVEYGDFVGESKSDYLDKRYPEDSVPADFPKAANLKEFTDVDNRFVNRNKEPIYFNIALVALGSIGQLLVSLLIILRIIILWFLLILSPFLFLLFTLNFLKQFFRYWIWFYFRWLFIGPILAMCLYIIVNIWSLTGVPIESTSQLAAGLWFDNATNLYLAAPGVASGFLNTPREVMKYLAALIMLYLAVFLPFWLTRRMGGSECCVDQGMLKRLRETVKPGSGKFSAAISVAPGSPGTPPPSDQGLAIQTGLPAAEQVELKDINIAALGLDSTGKGLAVLSKDTSSEKGVSGQQNNTTEKTDQKTSQSATTETSTQKDQTTSDAAEQKQQRDTTISESNDETRDQSGGKAQTSLSDSRFANDISFENTRSVLEKVNLAPLTNPARNESIDKIANRENNTNITQRNNLNAVYTELQKRAESGDRDARQAVNDIKQAERFSAQEGVSTKKTADRLEATDETQRAKGETGDIAATPGTIEQSANVLAGQEVSQEQSTQLSEGDEVMQLKEEVVGALTAGETKETVEKDLEEVDEIDRSRETEKVTEKLMMAELEDPDAEKRLEGDQEGEQQDDKEKEKEKKKDDGQDDQNDDQQDEQDQEPEDDDRFKDEDEKELEAPDEDEKLDPRQERKEVKGKDDQPILPA